MRRTRVTADPSARVVLSVNALAHVLGLDKGTVRQWAKRGLPIRQPGGPGTCRLVFMDELRDWLRSRPRIARTYH